jgi:NAD(P)-dependent dehydrogenase (short-subunit alcohol dehydrogenase family)
VHSKGYPPSRKLISRVPEHSSSPIKEIALDEQLHAGRTAFHAHADSDNSGRYAIEAIAEAMQQELKPFGIQVQTINPGAYLTGFNEAMAENAFRWLDDGVNFTKPAAVREMVAGLIGSPSGRMNPSDMIERMVEVIPEFTGKK